MRILLLCILIIFSLNVGADDTVRILNVATLTAVTGTTDFNFSLVAEAPSGDGTSEAAPEKIYIPIATTINAVNSTNYFYLNSQTTSHPIFGYTATAGASQTTFSGYTIDFPLVYIGILLLFPKQSCNLFEIWFIFCFSSLKIFYYRYV